MIRKLFEGKPIPYMGDVIEFLDSNKEIDKQPVRFVKLQDAGKPKIHVGPLGKVPKVIDWDQYLGMHKPVKEKYQSEATKEIQDVYDHATPIQQAYFDEYLIKLWGWKKFRFVERDAYSLRDLQWKSETGMKLKDAIEVFQSAVIQYNEFTPDVLKPLETIDPEMIVFPAREGSVAVYLSSPKLTLENLEALQHEMKFDELMKEPDGTFRLWWD